jgi:hypothetical protein
MSYGIEAYDPSGNLMFGQNDGIWRLSNEFNYSSAASGSSSYTFSVSGMTGTSSSDWLVFCEGSARSAFINTSTGQVTVYSGFGTFTTATGNRCLGIILKRNGFASSNIYGLQTYTGSGSNVQIDNEYDNYKLVGGGTGTAVGSNATPSGAVHITYPAGFSSLNSILLFAPTSYTGCVTRSDYTSGAGNNGDPTIRLCWANNRSNGDSIGTAGSANTYEWRCYAKTSSSLSNTGYGINVYDSSGNVIFSSNSYILSYKGKTTHTYPPVQSTFQTPSTPITRTSIDSSLQEAPALGRRTFALWTTQGVFGYYADGPVIAGNRAGLIGLNFNASTGGSGIAQDFNCVHIDWGGLPNAGFNYGTGSFEQLFFDAPATMPVL